MSLAKLTRIESNKLYLDVMQSKDTATMRKLCLIDLFFLITIACRRPDANNDFVYQRCRELEADKPDDIILDLWSREHYKSTLKTIARNIQRILNNPDITIGIFSHTRPIAKAFLGQIKREFEDNAFLKSLFPDILWSEPQKQSPKWSLDDGIIVNRKGNPKEATIEAWGLVDSSPTSKHFTRLNYDDIITQDSVTTPEMIKKVTDAWSLSLFLGSKGGEIDYVGTRYHQNDTYAEILRLGSARARYFYPTDKGKDDIEVEGNPVLMTKDQLIKIRQRGVYFYACQMLQNPHADKAMGFHPSWLRQYFKLTSTVGWNFYLLCDPANAKKKDNDYTVMMVVGLAPDNNYYLVDGLRDRLNLTERTNELFRLYKKWLPKNVGYERYGKDSDIDHIQYVQEQMNYRFGITELGGAMPKNDRIRRLVPIFEQGRFYTPVTLIFKEATGRVVDLMHIFRTEEYDTFPVSTHDDMLDCMSRIVEDSLGAVFPKGESVVHNEVEETYDPLTRKKTWDQNMNKVLAPTLTWKEAHMKR